MFSGKSSELKRLAKRAEAIRKKVLVINHSSDNRYTKEEQICTHDNEMMVCRKTISLAEVESDFKKYECIYIDEAQFFPDLILVRKYIHSIDFVVAGLNSDYNRRSIGNTFNLIPLADDIVFLKALCTCGNQAPFTARITPCDAPKTNIEVGGKDKYQAVCRQCYTNNYVQR